MKELVKQSGAEWIVRLRVIDRVAKAKGKKYLIYEFNGKVATENLDTQLLNAVIGMQHYGNEWKTNNNQVKE